MTGRALPRREAELLRRAAFTYDEVGGTHRRTTPPGYRTVRRSREIGSGTERFEQAAQTLLAWGMHRRTGLRVRTSSDEVSSGAVAILRLGVGPWGVDAPVRVVYVVDEPWRRGFAYGTLPGHPERGEEAFVVELRDDDVVIFTITAFSHPATWLAHAGGPFTRAIQSWLTSRYLRAV